MALGIFEWWQLEKCQNLAFCAKLPLFSDPITNMCYYNYVYIVVYNIIAHTCTAYLQWDGAGVYNCP